MLVDGFQVSEDKSPLAPGTRLVALAIFDGVKTAWESARGRVAILAHAFDSNAPLPELLAEARALESDVGALCAGLDLTLGRQPRAARAPLYVLAAFMVGVILGILVGQGRLG